MVFSEGVNKGENRESLLDPSSLTVHMELTHNGSLTKLWEEIRTSIAQEPHYDSFNQVMDPDQDANLFLCYGKRKNSSLDLQKAKHIRRLLDISDHFFNCPGTIPQGPPFFKFNTYRLYRIGPSLRLSLDSSLIFSQANFNFIKNFYGYVLGLLPQRNALMPFSLRIDVVPKINKRKRLGNFLSDFATRTALITQEASQG